MAKVMSFRATPFGLECCFSCLSAVTLMSYLTILEEEVSFQSQRKAMPKNVETTTQLHSSHTLAKECSKFSKPGQQYVNHEIPDVQAGFRKGRGTRDQIANIPGSSKKQESSTKTSVSALLTMPKLLTVWITTNCGKFFKRWEYQTT